MSSCRIALVPFGLVLALTGCVTRSPESRIGELSSGVPKSWSATKEARAGVDRDWIRSFGDAGLVALVKEAVLNNPDLRVSSERVRRAEAIARLSGVGRKPQLTGQVTGLLQQRRFPGFPIRLDSNTAEVYGASLEVNWEMDLWGRLRASEGAAIAEQQAQLRDHQAARASLSGQLAKLWFMLGETGEQISLARAALEVREKTVMSIRERFGAALEGGLASQLRLAETDLASSRAVLARWEGERARVLRQIELLAGRYPDGSLMNQNGLPRLPKAPPAGLPSELLLRRPDILAAERRYAAAGENLKVTRLARYPSFSLTGGAGTTTSALEKILDSRFGIWSLAGGVVQPLVSGGRLSQEERIAGHDEEVALRELQAAVLRAFGEVEQALVAEKFFARREESVAESARSAREAAEAAIKDFADGAVDALVLLAAQDRQIQTAFQLVSLRRMRLENRINLHLALGGDFKLSAER